MIRRRLATATVITLLLNGCSGLPSSMRPAAPTTPAEASVTLPRPDEVSADIARDWFDAFLLLIKTTPGYTPPVASRFLGYAGVTLYESLVPGLPNYDSLVPLLNEMDSLPAPDSSDTYYWPAVSNAAMAQLATDFFPHAPLASKAVANSIETKYSQRHSIEADRNVLQRSQAYGTELAKAVFEWSKTDGGHQGYDSNFIEAYKDTDTEGDWVPTPRYEGKAPLPPMQPHWGRNRSLLAEHANECSSGEPYEYSTDPESDFYREAKEVYDTVKELTDEQRAIAIFWADDPGKTATPPGHSFSILNQLIADSDLSLATASEIYAKLGLAVSDAFIKCWQEKFQYNVIRPITYIQAQIDPVWNTPLVKDPVETPPFPEYPSGHSLQSGAAEVILTAYFGNQSFTDYTHSERGLAARHFASVHDAFEEAAISRLYGGIHYRAAIERGLATGRCIGKNIYTLPMRRS